MDSLSPDYPRQTEERTHRLQLLGLNTVAPEAAFDQVAQVASTLTESPLAVVNFHSAQRQMYRGVHASAEAKDRAGSAFSELGRDVPADFGFCPHVVAQGEQLALDDVFDHPRLRENPMVGSLGVRSYLGTPLRDHTGMVLGTVAVFDTRPRTWTPQLKTGVQLLCQTLLPEFKLRGSLLTQQQQLFAIFDRAPFPIMLTEGPEHRVRYANATQGDAFGLVPRLSQGRQALSGLDAVGVFKTMDQAYHTGQTVTLPEARLIPYNSAAPKVFSFTCTPVRLSPAANVISGVLTVAMDVTGQPGRADETRKMAAQFQDRFEQMGPGTPSLATGQLPSGSSSR